MSRFWKYLFFALPILYGILYAPYGINETDGGFLTGLGWQVLQGQILYQDVIYVRPPLSVWLRGFELYLLPDHWAVLGERWIFYFKVATYSYLGATLLYVGQRRWILAVFAYIVSVHCYPAAAWHTIDGILFAVMGVWFSAKASDRNMLLSPLMGAFLGGICIVLSMLSKQSFYPLALAFILFLIFSQGIQYKKAVFGLGGMFVGAAAFAAYLTHQNLWHGFLQSTTQSANKSQALEHGILDYFRITPGLAIPSILILFFVFYKGKLSFKLESRQWLFMGWVLALSLSFAVVTWLRQLHTVPFAQSRMLFWLAAFCAFFALWNQRNYKSAMLLSITWCGAVSWGYNLPLLFALPLVWGIMEAFDSLQIQHKKQQYFSILLLITTLTCFRVGYEFVYRDGKRSAMNTHLGNIFPRLHGIYSSQETADQYADLKRIIERYGSNFAVLPAFPQAHFLTDTRPVLPLGWVVNRETNHSNDLIIKTLESKRPILIFEKNYLPKFQTDPELSLCKTYFDKSFTVEETPFFIVKKL